MNLKVSPPKDLLEDLALALAGDKNRFQGNGPSADIEMGEQVLGTLEDPVARALWILSDRIKSAMKNDHGEYEKLDSDDQMMHEKLFRTLDSADDIVRVCSRLFWVRLHMIYPQAHKRGLTMGVRNGWRVVAMKSSDSPLDLLRGFLNPDRD